MANFRYRKKITIDHTKVAGEDLQDFPVLIALKGQNLKTVANGGHVTSSDGTDISLAGVDGEALGFETEEYDPAVGELWVWIRVPHLSASADIIIYVCYGGSRKTALNKNKVWDNNFRLVKHLDRRFDGEKHLTLRTKKRWQCLRFMLKGT